MAAWLARNWWAIALRGGLAVLFGILTVFWPNLTVAVLVLLFGAYALMDGVFALAAAISGQAGSHGWALVLEGIIGIAAGVLTFAWPEATLLALLSLIAVWALVTGILEIAAAIRLRAVIENEWVLALSGVLSVLFGIVALLWPGPTVLALAWLLGIYAILFGVLLLVLAFRLRSLARPTSPVGGI